MVVGYSNGSGEEKNNYRRCCGIEVAVVEVRVE